MDWSDREKIMDIIFHHIANGGDMISLSKEWGTQYSKVMSWIWDDKERTEQYNKALSARDEWAVERLLSEIRSISFSDLTQLYDENGFLLEPRDWPEEVKRNVQALDQHDITEKGQRVGVVKKVKLYDKLKALELMGKTMSLFKERVDHGITESFADLVMASYESEPSGEGNEQSNMGETEGKPE